MSRNTLLLLIIILLAALSYFYLLNKQPIQKTVPAFDYDSLRVNKFILKTKNDTLVLTKLNQKWVISNLNNYPADLDRIKGLFNNVLKVQRSKKVLTDDIDKLDFYQLTPDKGTNIQVYDKNNHCFLDFYLGISDLYTYSCMRNTKDSKVYELADNLSSYIASIKELWRDPFIFRYQEEDLIEIRVFANKNIYSLTAKNKEWLYKSAYEEFPVYTTNRSLFKILNVLRSLKTLNIHPITNELKNKYFKDPILTLELSIKNINDYKLTCYKYNQDDSIVLFNGIVDYAFVLPYDFINRFTKSSENFKDYSDQTY